MSFYKQSKHYFVRVKQSYFPQKLSSVEIEFANNHLKPELRDMFFAQPLCDQRHGFLVFERCKKIFDRSDGLFDDELFLVSALHDVAKTKSFASVTMRIVAALILSVVDKSKLGKFENSTFAFMKRIGVYADHSKLSADILSKYTDSEFVLEATLYHHKSKSEIIEKSIYPTQVLKFIEADTL